MRVDGEDLDAGEITRLPAHRHIFCTRLAEIENIGGGCLRFTLVEKRGDGEEPVAEIIAPISAVPEAIVKMIAAIGGAAPALLFRATEMN